LCQVWAEWVRWRTRQSRHELLVVCGTDIAAEGEEEKLEGRLAK
jgi:hypothetical protein